MTSLIDGNATALLSMALDAATLRQQAIAQNIANANTPGYRRMAVTFESQLNALTDANGHVRQPAAHEASGMRPVMAFADGDGKVALDTEVAHLSETVLHHQALLKALNKHFALLSTAISEGKR